MYVCACACAHVFGNSIDLTVLSGLDRLEQAWKTVPVGAQAQAAAEASAEQATLELSDADKETELLEAQLEQLTDSLRHTSARKQELESELRNFEQVCIPLT